MNLSQITAFQAVMTSTSLSDAARKLGRTQPAVSLAIRSLEESLGIALFKRKGHQLVPVPEAHYLLAEANEILSRLSTVTRTMRSLAGGLSGSLNVSAFPGAAAFVFPRFIASMVDEPTETKVTITSRSSPQIEELARTQSIDFGFCDAPTGTDQSAQYDIDHISAECFLALPRDHPLSKADRITLRQLDAIPMGSLQHTHQHHGRTIEAFEAAGAHFRGVIESQTFMPLLHFVQGGKCLALVDPLSVVNESHLLTTQRAVVFRRLAQSFRYNYAVLSPIHRPLSQLALRVRAAWRSSIFALLQDAGADPLWEQRSPSFSAEAEEHG
ncbi:MAG: LysR family transcriptional regulator [Pseudomonadota bacterium]